MARGGRDDGNDRVAPRSDGTPTGERHGYLLFRRWWVQAAVGVVVVTAAYDLAGEPQLLGIIKVTFVTLFGGFGIGLVVAAVAARLSMRA